MGNVMEVCLKWDGSTFVINFEMIKKFLFALKNPEFLYSSFQP